MEPKTKIGIIGLVVIVLVVVGVGICWMVGKNTVPSLKKAVLKESKKEIFTKVAEGESVKKLEPKLVWEKEFDSEIVDFVVPRMAGIRKGNEFPIVAIRIGNYENNEIQKLIFFDKKGNEINRRYLVADEMPIASENGKYLLIVKIKEEFFCDIIYITKDGKVLWKKKDMYGVSGRLSPFGNVIIMAGTMSNGKYGICFYNKKGEKIKDCPEFRAALSMGEFSGDEKFYCQSFFNNFIKEESIVLFDKNGGILWRYDFEEKRERPGIEKLLISSDGEIVSLIYRLCRGYKGKGEDCSYIYTFNTKGKLLWKKQWKTIFTLDGKKVVSTIEDIDLSPDGKYLLIRFTDYLSLFENFTGKEIILLKLKDMKKYKYCESLISSNGNIISIILGNSWGEDEYGVEGRINGEKLYIINKAGKILFEKIYTDKFIKEIKFVDDIPIIIFKKDKQLFVHKLVEVE